MAEEIVGGYRLLNLIMTGQTSQVWEVVEASSHRHFAMKILLPEHAGKGDAKSALIHEAKVGQKLANDVKCGGSAKRDAGVFRDIVETLPTSRPPDTGDPAGTDHSART